MLRANQFRQFYIYNNEITTIYIGWSIWNDVNIISIHCVTLFYIEL